MFYFIRPPKWLRYFFKDCIWQISTSQKEVFLTFDDGPHPTITPFVLDELKKHQAKATFFCIGKNVELYPEIYRRIIDEGHMVGNHTYNHLNGWKTPTKEYLDNIGLAQKRIDSHLFRPPYGRISRFQLKNLQLPRFKMKTIMWSVLSGDFDLKLSKEKCLDHVLLHYKAGDIIVFHDSEKAFERLAYVLPKCLEHFRLNGFSCNKIFFPTEN